MQEIHFGNACYYAVKKLYINEDTHMQQKELQYFAECFVSVVSTSRKEHKCLKIKVL